MQVAGMPVTVEVTDGANKTIKYRCEVADQLLPAVYKDFGHGDITDPDGIGVLAGYGQLVEGTYRWTGKCSSAVPSRPLVVALGRVQPRVLPISPMPCTTVITPAFCWLWRISQRTWSGMLVAMYRICWRTLLTAVNGSQAFPCYPRTNVGRGASPRMHSGAQSLLVA